MKIKIILLLGIAVLFLSACSMKERELATPHTISMDKTSKVKTYVTLDEYIRQYDAIPANKEEIYSNLMAENMNLINKKSYEPVTEGKMKNLIAYNNDPVQLQQNNGLTQLLKDIDLIAIFEVHKF